MRSLLVAFICACIALPAHAQTGTFAGTVARDSLGTALAGAEVQLSQANRTATTNDLGEFQFGGVPPGRYAVTVRAVGFDPFVDSIAVRPGATVDVDILLTAVAVNLNATRVFAAAPETHDRPGIAEMEARRRLHTGGFFLTDSTLRANDERKLTYLLAQAPRLNEVFSQTGSAVYVAVPGPAPPVPNDPTARAMAVKSMDGTTSAQTDGTFSVKYCYVNVYLNGGKYWAGPPSPFNPPPDIGSLWAREYSGVEYYSSSSVIPSEYNNGINGWPCGVLLLWTRR